MTTEINKVIKDGNGNAIVFTALIAAAIANTIPTPFDAIYFNRQRTLKQELEEGKISVEKYWLHDSGEYYLWTTLWYVGLITVLAAIGGNYKTNSRILIGLTGAGLVAGVIAKNIEKDKKIQELKNKNNERK